MLYIMRHGRTEWNARHKLQGRTDIPLSEEGRVMAAQAGQACAGIHFDVCYCSPLIRARETAQIVLAGRDVPIIADARLVEMSFGIYEGIENSFQVPDCPVNVIFTQPQRYVTPFEGAESFEDLYKRTGDFLKSVALPLVAQGKDVLIVGHGAMNLSIICQIQNIPLERFWSVGMENCKLMRLL